MKRNDLTKLAGALACAGVLNFSAFAGEHEFRTDINPALLYFQAYQTMPQLNAADSKYLFEGSGSWPQLIDERRANLLKQYDNSFKLLRRARFSSIPCDWGYDLTLGPEALLPGLAPAKVLMQVMRLRADAALDAGEFESLRDDLLAAFTLGRNLASDHILISCLVQNAIENICYSILMENYYRFTAEQFDLLIAGLDSAPRRGTIADTIQTEHTSFYGYFVRKIQGLIAESHGDEALFWSRFEPFWNPIATDIDSSKGPDPSAAQIKEAAGGSSAAVLRLLNELPPLYVEVERLMRLPYAQYKELAPAFFAKIAGSPNPFVKMFFTVFARVRAKEFTPIVRQQMVRAAAAFKRGGMEALHAVADPLAGGPFEFSRVIVEGADRGFQLKSREHYRDFDEVTVFIEKPGKEFWLEGKNAGKIR